MWQLCCSSYNCEGEVTDPSSHWAFAVELVPAPWLLPSFEGLSLGVQGSSSQKNQSFKAALCPSLLLGNLAQNQLIGFLKLWTPGPSAGFLRQALGQLGMPTLNKPLVVWGTRKDAGFLWGLWPLWIMPPSLVQGCHLPRLFLGCSICHSTVVT